VLAAARNADKLRRLAERRGRRGDVQVDVGDRAALERLAARSRVSSTPSAIHRLRRACRRAAIAHGPITSTHGRAALHQKHAGARRLARKQGVAVVPAQAFEVAVSDSAAAVAADGYRDVTSVHVTYVTRFHPSQGTQRTVLAQCSRAPGTPTSAASGWRRRRRVTCARSPDRPHRSVTTVSFPSAEVITIRATSRRARCACSWPYPVWRRASSRQPHRCCKASCARRWRRYPPGSLAAARTAPTTHAARRRVPRRGRRPGVRRGAAAPTRVLVHGVDPYGLTAVAAAYGAEQMRRPEYIARACCACRRFDARPFLDSWRRGD